MGGLPLKMATRGRQALSRWRLTKAGALRHFDEIAGRRPDGAFGPEYGALEILYRAVRTIKPSVVMEFGSGWSTYILAQAIADNRRVQSQPDGKLYSIDADEKWATVTREGLPQDFVEFCEVTYSPLLEVEFDGVKGFRHGLVPKIAPEFVFLDGPAFTSERRVAVDVLDIEAAADAPFHILIDKRHPNAEFLRTRLRFRYRYRRERDLFRTSYDVHRFEPST